MNDLGLKGIEFVEFASPRPEQLDRAVFDAYASFRRQRRV